MLELPRRTNNGLHHIILNLGEFSSCKGLPRFELSIKINLSTICNGPFLSAHSSVTLDSCGGSDVIFTVVVDTDDHEQGNQWYLQYTSGATTSTCAQSDEAVTTTSSVAGTMTTYTVTVAGMISSACGNYVSIGRSRRPGELAA